LLDYEREEAKMQPLLDRMLTVNLICSTLIFYVCARIYILPRVKEWKPQAILLPILLLHSFRHLGLMFLTRGAVYPGMPAQFAYPAAVGDFLAAMLAFAAIPALAKNPRGGRFLLWVFNIGGTADLIIAIMLATIYGAPAFMGAAYWIPAFWVPALLVTHYVAFVVLMNEKAGAAA
jgi:hypothetical protein